jgi:hypothetical protein
MVARVLASSIEPPPAPWRRIGIFAVGGLTDVGFAPHSNLLLVVSSAGRGIIDCSTGDRVARDPSVPEDDENDWQDRFHLEAEGIGPLAGQAIRTAGLFGGGLPLLTSDGWRVERLALEWPEESLLLVPPEADLYSEYLGRPAAFSKLAVESEVRAWGFSPTGRSLVLATSSDLTVWGRCAEPSA